MLTIKQARDILGEKADCLTDEEIKTTITVFDRLTDFVLDSYEQDTFGKTLKEMGVDYEN